MKRNEITKQISLWPENYASVNLAKPVKVSKKEQWIALWKSIKEASKSREAYKKLSSEQKNFFWKKWVCELCGNGKKRFSQKTVKSFLAKTYPNSRANKPLFNYFLSRYKNFINEEQFIYYYPEPLCAHKYCYKLKYERKTGVDCDACGKSLTNLNHKIGSVYFGPYCWKKMQQAQKEVDYCKAHHQEIEASCWVCSFKNIKFN